MDTGFTLKQFTNDISQASFASEVATHTAAGALGACRNPGYMRPIKPAASAGDVDTNSTGLGVIVSGVAAVNTMRSFTITGGNGKTLEFSTHFTQVCKPLYGNFRSRHKEHPDCILKMFKNCLSGKTVVDLGCGSGRMRSFKKDLGAFPLAVDVSNTNYPTESRNLPRVYGNYCRPKVINDVLRRVATFPVLVLSGN